MPTTTLNSAKSMVHKIIIHDDWLYVVTKREKNSGQHHHSTITTSKSFPKKNDSINKNISAGWNRVPL